jgi:hypothetical protein
MWRPARNCYTLLYSLPYASSKRKGIALLKTLSETRSTSRPDAVLGRGLFALCLVLASVSAAQAQDASAPIRPTATRVKGDPSPVSEPKYRPVALRLGGNFSPQTGLAIGLDFTPRGLHLAPGLSTRFDFEAAFNTRSGGSNGNSLQGTIDPIASLTINQVYSNPANTKNGLYIGAGFGIYSGPTGNPNTGTGLQLFGPTYHDQTLFGGKIFAGTNFTSTTGGEASVHFAGSTTLFMVQLRLKL